MRAHEYQGSELELFAKAVNWKCCVFSHLEPYLRGHVLEVGAGIGANAGALASGRFERWTCLEPDAGLAARIPQHAPPGDARFEIQIGTLANISPEARFDAILYLDVLEHIEDDRGEVARAAALLAEGGHLAVLAPAFPWLYSPFDRAIGHFRRYTRRALASLTTPPLQLERIRYLDLAGLLASSGIRLLLKQAQPTESQILFWDRKLVPLSRYLDPVSGYRAGRSVLAIWKKAEKLEAARPAMFK